MNSKQELLDEGIGPKIEYEELIEAIIKYYGEEYRDTINKAAENIDIYINGIEKLNGIKKVIELLFENEEKFNENRVVDKTLYWTDNVISIENWELCNEIGIYINNLNLKNKTKDNYINNLVDIIHEFVHVFMFFIGFEFIQQDDNSFSIKVGIGRDYYDIKELSDEMGDIIFSKSEGTNFEEGFTVVDCENILKILGFTNIDPEDLGYDLEAEFCKSFSKVVGEDNIRNAREKDDFIKMENIIGIEQYRVIREALDEATEYFMQCDDSKKDEESIEFLKENKINEIESINRAYDMLEQVIIQNGLEEKFKITNDQINLNNYIEI